MFKIITMKNVQSIKCLTSKNTGKLSFLTLKGDAKFEEKLTCGLWFMINFYRSNLKSQNWDLIQSRKSMKLKSTEELCVMKKKNDAKFEEELTCHFKMDMRNLMNFDPNC